MRLKGVICLFVILFFSCSRTAVKKPSEQPLLGVQVVEEMLLEIHLIEGKARVLIYSESAEKVKSLLNYEMKNLFERYNTTYKQFTESYSYYMGDASVSKKMMSDITNRLIVMEAKQTKNKKLEDLSSSISMILLNKTAIDSLNKISIYSLIME